MLGAHGPGWPTGTDMRPHAPLLRLLMVIAPLLPCAAAAQDADATPSFDRPGLGIGTDTVARGAWAVEMGLPDWERDRDRDGVRSDLLGTDATLRTGLSQTLELQLMLTPWQRLREHARGPGRQHIEGAGDSEIGVKWAPGSDDTGRWAALASTTLAKGEAAFSDGRRYSLAATYEYPFSERITGALYGRYSRGDGDWAGVWSPSLTMTFNPRWSGFLEAGFTRERGQQKTSVAGGGVIWAPRAGLQFDASVDLGLDADSPDLQAGLGVSFYLR